MKTRIGSIVAALSFVVVAFALPTSANPSYPGAVNLKDSNGLTKIQYIKEVKISKNGYKALSNKVTLAKLQKQSWDSFQGEPNFLAKDYSVSNISKQAFSWLKESDTTPFSKIGDYIVKNTKVSKEDWKLFQKDSKFADKNSFGMKDFYKDDFAGNVKFGSEWQDTSFVAGSKFDKESTYQSACSKGNVTKNGFANLDMTDPSAKMAWSKYEPSTFTFTAAKLG